MRSPSQTIKLTTRKCYDTGLETKYSSPHNLEITPWMMDWAIFFFRIEAAEKYLLQQFNSAIDKLKEEFHKRVDMDAINDQVENAQEKLAELAKGEKNLLEELR